VSAPKLTKARRRTLENIAAGRPWNLHAGNGMGGASRRMLIDMKIEGLLTNDGPGDWPGVLTDIGRAALRGES